MALGDRVVVTYDDGGRSTATKEVRAGSAGGSVTWERKDGFVEVVERSKNKRDLRRLAFREERVVSVEYEPGR